ncbi:hypothetical protein D3C77_398410 [compost metagenome]
MTTLPTSARCPCFAQISASNKLASLCTVAKYNTVVVPFARRVLTKSSYTTFAKSRSANLDSSGNVYVFNQSYNGISSAVPD